MRSLHGGQRETNSGRRGTCQALSSRLCSSDATDMCCENKQLNNKLALKMRGCKTAPKHCKTPDAHWNGRISNKNKGSGVEAALDVVEDTICSSAPGA